ncbi:MAG: hypothetical protein DM484_19925 [Candidatus Methylumidiphilus alinenensis]|uniref:Uncharacterized protein n=1 Tax=Candidatus Methylumidiphilus alinenensis TaxID=2202197 RepID=A0A2W4QVA7_9GAMM|nr:MAG: hypothetical protein DM484_19925 [Candidatus Methylumidiphilus alinenensis]
MIFKSKKQLFWPLFFYSFIHPSFIRDPPALFSLFAKNREPKKNEHPGGLRRPAPAENQPTRTASSKMQKPLP